MGLFRRSTIFHVEETLPDPEELKLRFRRRVLLSALLGFLLVLGIPVARDLRPILKARAEARRFAEEMIRMRLVAGVSRVPLSQEISSDRQGWIEIFHVPSESCAQESTGPHPVFRSEGFLWKAQAQRENGETLAVRSLCWHPQKGLLVNSSPIDNGKLLLSLGMTEEGASEKELASILVTQSGTELQTIMY